jgi:hypothetical protein
MVMFIPKNIALKLNITWAKCKVAIFLLLRQKGDRTTNQDKIMNQLVLSQSSQDIW